MVQPLVAIRRDKLHEQVARCIEEKIVKGEYPVGSVLPSERELADQLDVGLTTVRYAVRILAARGLVEVRQGVGATVTQDGRQSFGDMLELLLKRNSYEFEDLAEFRDLLEPQAAAIAAQRATNEDLIQLKLAFGRFCDAVDSDNMAEVQHAHAEFHVAMVASAENPVLSDLLAPILRVAARITSLFDEDPESATGEKESHQAICDCIAAHNSEGARKLLEVHRRSLAEQLAVARRLTVCP